MHLLVRFELAVTAEAGGLCSNARNYKGNPGGAANGTLRGALFFLLLRRSWGSLFVIFILTSWDSVLRVSFSEVASLSSLL